MEKFEAYCTSRKNFMKNRHIFNSQTQKLLGEIIDSDYHDKAKTCEFKTITNSLVWSSDCLVCRSTKSKTDCWNTPLSPLRVQLCKADEVPRVQNHQRITSATKQIRDQALIDMQGPWTGMKQQQKLQRMIHIPTEDVIQLPSIVFTQFPFNISSAQYAFPSQKYSKIWRSTYKYVGRDSESSCMEKVLQRIKHHNLKLNTSIDQV